MRYLLFILFIWFQHIPSALAADIKRLAVLEFTGAGADPIAVDVFSDGTRTAVIKIINKEEILVMTRESISEIMKDMGKDISCVEGECEVEIGRNIGADYIITGSIAQLDEEYILTLKFLDTHSGALLASETSDATDLNVLRKTIPEISQKMLQEGLQTKKIDSNDEVAQEKSKAPNTANTANIEASQTSLAPVNESLSFQAAQFHKHTAKTLSDGQWAIGVFAPLRYGLKDDIELEIHPIWAFMAPHIALKKSYQNKGNLKLASRHQLGYPTLLLSKVLARPGIGGILAPDSVIPHTLVSQNDLYLGRTTKYGELTSSLGASLALELSESSYTTIDAPYGFRATNLYQNTVSVQLGVGWEYFFTEKLGFRMWSKAWFYPLAEQKWTLEEKDVLLLQLSESSQAAFGCNIVLAEYPYGIQWHILPSFDWVWTF